jgi:hypothetical protein
MMKKIAMWLSVFGHPAIAVPLTVILLSWHMAVPSLWELLIPIIILVILLMGFAIWQVRRKKWKDLDASLPHERRLFLTALAVCLFAAILAVLLLRLPYGLGLGLSIAGIQVIIAILLARLQKISFHSLISAYCSILLLPLGLKVALFGLLWTGLVSWSRVVLARHTIKEVISGAGLGCAGGIVFWLLHQG